ncbi:serine--tRNA ligase [Cesiribacter andamanensis]|uniref:Serine--tRNA ligase n=1 Tax=Cesiribacter andamanensis AMV16 TaxID=1279009 RepID=M7N266_9BACT|nr:serine--tRNA ligase [Cesiribacter andamanensis]EMR01407.1 Serine--tRNA ligase [Cesiribacter andamanensis AMV16]
MLSVPQIKDNKDTVITGLLKKKFKQAEETIEKVLALDDARRSTQKQQDDLLAEQNAASKQIGQLMQQGKRDEAEAAKARVADIKAESKELGDKLQQYTEQLTQLLYTIPNVPHERVPEGATPEENIEVETGGSKPSLPPTALPHWELIKEYDLIDFELGIKITGAGFPVYKGKGARLQRALINFFLDQALAAGYTEYTPPLLVNEASGLGTGQLPDKEGQMYHATADNLYLIPTAEVPITNLFRDVILAESELPVKCVGYTPCFRREAGSWGAHVRGLNRLHQFDKVEIVQIARPEDSYTILEDMRRHATGLLQLLELPYRVIVLCGGDMGFTSALTYDLEVWSGAQERWLEVSSVSNFETYQSNRLKLRYKPEEGKSNQLAHTLNGSALALPRIMAALLENGQTPEGIRIPKALQPYCGFEMITK